MQNIRKILSKLNNIHVNGEKIYLFMFVITLISSFLINTTFAQFIPVKVFDRVIYLTMFILLIKIYILDNIKLSELLGITVLLLIAVYSWRKTTYIAFMVMATYIVAARSVDFNKIIKYYFNTNLTLILGVTIYSLVGIIKNLAYSRNGVIRYALGIDYPTDYAAYIFYLILAYSFLNYKKLNSKIYLFYGLIAVLLNVMTNARLDVILIFLTIIFFAVSKSAEKRINPLTRFIASNYWSQILILPYAYLLLNIYFTSKNKIFLKLNNLLSGRLFYGHLALINYPIKLLSQKVNEHGWGGVQGLKLFKQEQEKYFFIDSSFIRLLVIYGLVIFVLVICTMLWISLKGTVNASYLMPTIILLITISSLIDQHLLELTYNPFLLILFATYEKSKGIKYEGKRYTKDHKK